MWQEQNGELYKEFTFKDFKEAFDFMRRVAAVAEERRHHPRWENNWNSVKIWLSTHSENAITQEDHDLADAIDRMAGQAEAGRKASEQITNKPHPTEIKLYGDGGSRGNPGHSAGGFALLDMDDRILVKSGKYLGITTNNQAEYHSLKGGLEAAQALGVQTVHVFMDSLLVINQMKGIFKVKNRDLWPIHDAIKKLLPQFKHVDFTHVPREFNKLADSIVNETLDSQGH